MQGPLTRRGGPTTASALCCVATLLLLAVRCKEALDLKALACRRVYSSEQAENGSVSSPGYPRPYPPDTRCVYEFEGKPTQRVQLLFTDFSLYHPIENPPDDCDEGDALVAFARGAERVHEIERLCGGAQTLPRPIMSSGPLLTLEFSGAHAGSHARGFHATYAFVQNFGMTSGQQLSAHGCVFAFNSSEVEGSGGGAFHSPNFPGLYPRDTECHFLFFGGAKERVRLRFTHFDVEGVRPCSDSSASDYVEFSNFYGADRKFERQCGRVARAFEVESDRKFFRVTFRSNDRLDGTGFNASFRFVDEEDSFASSSSSSTGLQHKKTTKGPRDGASSRAEASLLPSAVTPPLLPLVMPLVLQASWCSRPSL